MAYAIGEQVKTKDGKVGKLLGVVAGVAHIGVGGGIITARSADLKRADGEPTKRRFEIHRQGRTRKARGS
jgi:hypothetical protein